MTVNPEAPALVLDCLGWKCPRPVIELARRLPEVPLGALVEVLADDLAAGPDLAAWCRMRQQTLVSAEAPRFLIRHVT